MPRVVFTAHLRRHVDVPEQVVAGSTVADALGAAFACAPQLRGYVLDDQGELRRHVAVYVDGRRVADRKRLSDPVTEASEIWVLQALSGG
jgi:molybdopterin converting factor small subunit